MCIFLSYCINGERSHFSSPNYIQVSLGNINPQANAKYSKALFGFFGKKLGIKDDRGYMCVIQMTITSPS